MHKLLTTLAFLPLFAFAGPGTGTFEEGGLRWIRDHGPEPHRLHMTKDFGGDSSPDVWAQAKGHCSWRAKIEVPHLHPSLFVGRIEEYLEWLWEQEGTPDEPRNEWKYLRRLRMDRYPNNLGEDRGLRTWVQVSYGQGWLGDLFGSNNRTAYSYNDNAFNGTVGGTEDSARWKEMKNKFDTSMEHENYVHYAYWDGIQQFDLGSFHSAKIGKTGKWNDDGVWRHKVRIKTCEGWWDQTYELDTLSERATDFDRAIHQGIDAVFKRGPACAAKGGWDATYIDKHSGGNLYVTHRCNGKRSDGHFARAERRFTMEESRRFVDLLAKSVDHY